MLYFLGNWNTVCGIAAQFLKYFGNDALESTEDFPLKWEATFVGQSPPGHKLLPSQVFIKLF